MSPIRDDEDDILARLEARLDSVCEIVSGLKVRNAELEGQLRAALQDRDAAAAEVETARQEMKQFQDEAEALRTRQKQAASRIKTLLNQVEQMDLLSEN
jgi:chromosome segregation ATPase